MNCLEAQSNIVAFIEDKLEDEKMLEFIRHIRNCDNCAEELEIYYTLMVGMKQLDEQENLSSNFQEELNKKIDIQYNRIRTKKQVKMSSILFIIVGFICFGIIGFESYQEFLYSLRQREMKDAQPEYYYSEYFSNTMFHPNEYHLRDFTIKEEKEFEPTYYEKVNLYIERMNEKDEDLENE